MTSSSPRMTTITALVITSLLAQACVPDEPEARPDAQEHQREDSAPMTKEEAAAHKQEGKADFPFDLCELRGWYEDDHCDWFCPERDPVCVPEPLGPAPAGDRTEHPIILAHGFNAGRQGLWGFYKVEEALISDGHVVYSTEVPAFDTAEHRAAHLAAQLDDILAETGAARVNIIAHSMGGLDARAMISQLGYGDRVASLTTISSPHRGSAVADIALKLSPGKTDDAIDAIATLWSRTFNEVRSDANVRGALTSLSTDRAIAFNEENPDDARVYYQSWAGVSSVLGLDNPLDDVACEGKLLWHEGQSDPMSSLLIATAAMIAPGTSFTPNDGMASVESAKWGRFQGCIPADHLDEVGQIRRDGPDPHTGFDHVRFYRNIAYDLSARGF